ncbi:hypothetical protein [Amycolatopsis sp. lyj-346]|uniref:hypothetical protein n=1 Tax=Amycolatopsis sp. lyj-346 TaxID=2789289 RepID=UPI00397CF200
MAIEVKRTDGDLTFEEADGYVVTDGHLNIYAERNGNAEMISTFAPKTWVSVHEVGSYKNTTEPPGIA